MDPIDDTSIIIGPGNGLVIIRPQAMTWKILIQFTDVYTAYALPRAISQMPFPS